jgi:hypothetical protein
MAWRQWLLGATLAIAGAVGSARADSTFSTSNGVTLPIPAGFQRLSDADLAGAVTSKGRLRLEAAFRLNTDATLVVMTSQADATKAFSWTDQAGDQVPLPVAKQFARVMFAELPDFRDPITTPLAFDRGRTMAGVEISFVTATDPTRQQIRFALVGMRTGFAMIRLWGSAAAAGPFEAAWTALWTGVAVAPGEGFKPKTPSLRSRVRNLLFSRIDSQTLGELAFDFTSTLFLGVVIGLVLGWLLTANRLAPLKKVMIVVLVGPWLGFMFLQMTPPALGGLGRGLGWLVATLALIVPAWRRAHRKPATPAPADAGKGSLAD